MWAVAIWLERGAEALSLAAFCRGGEHKSENGERFWGALGCDEASDASEVGVGGGDTGGKETKVEAGFLEAAALDA